MTRESAEVKARRYITEGRLLIELVDRQRIVASCRGAGELYALGYDRGGWHCSCPARGRCCHLVALMLVAIAPPLRRQEAA